ncbi:hypothetical protein PSYJA_08945 [Pseudomonas syringae pv. japonica str. M301072]|uniref:Uncharacterized protein n=1 Tax=Pseudomonas syringae pv. japonica str. M301072 TaxID=629262 RepID=F3FFV6_PSESX|nr:hypothetical protein PSYJA_08945 [Pseudomonas syringae pv. japonica str. M301072]
MDMAAVADTMKAVALALVLAVLVRVAELPAGRRLAARHRGAD